MKTKGTVCRRVLATFILAAMLVTSSAVTAYAAPEGATVIDLTVAGGGGGQDEPYDGHDRLRLGILSLGCFRYL